MNDDGCEGAIEAPCVVTLKGAVAPVLAVTLLFVDWASAVVSVLQRSRNAVHLRSGAPIVGIAWAHSLARHEFLLVGCSGVDTGHEHRCICGGLGDSVQCEPVFAQRHVAGEWLIRPHLHLCSSSGW